MREKRRRIFSVFLALALVLGLAPGLGMTARADATLGSSDLTIDGTALTQLDQGYSIGGGTATVSVAGDSLKLTLNKVNLESSVNSVVDYKGSAPLIVEIVGDNVITKTSASGWIFKAQEKDVTFTGSGSLTIKPKDSSATNITGLDCKELHVNLDIKGMVYLSGSGGYYTAFSLSSHQNPITLGDDVKIYSGNYDDGLLRTTLDGLLRTTVEGLECNLKIAKFECKHLHRADGTADGAGEDVEYLGTLKKRDIYSSLTLAGGRYHIGEDLTGRLIIKDTVYLCLNGHKLDATGENGAAITVMDGATLYLCDCKAQDGTEHHYKIENNLGVIQETGDDNTAGSFRGGYITGGNSGNGGGVTVRDRGNFYLYSGTIIGNRPNNSAYAGGVTVEDSGNFYMYGGNIVGNSTAGEGGGVSVSSGKFVMSGGLIAHNTASQNGGGVIINYSGALEMSGGAEIRNNTARNGGGIYTAGPVTMNGGKISGNTANQSAGGVELNGSSAKLTMTGGAEISGNRADNYGGGVNVNGFGAELKMSDGSTITGNQAQNRGGGVDVANKNLVTLGGKVTITGNTLNDNTVSNVYLNKDTEHSYEAFITDGDGAIDPESRVGITLGTADGKGIFTRDVDLTKAVEYESKGIFSDDTGRWAVLLADETNGELKLDTVVHVVYFKDAERTNSETLTVDKGTALTGKIPNQSREGYYFAGWTTNYKPSYSYKDAMPNDAKNSDDVAKHPYLLYDLSTPVVSDLTLYPVFIKDRINVNLVLGDGTMDGQSPIFTTEIDEKIRMLVVDGSGNVDAEHGMLRATRSGYTLAGWYTQGGVLWNGSDWKNATADAQWWPMTPEYADSSTPVKHETRPYNYYTVTLTARWEEVHLETVGGHTITFKYNDNTTPDNATYNIDPDTALTQYYTQASADIPERQHYNYQWNPQLAKMPGYDLTVNLEWTPIEYTMTLKKGNGESDEVLRGIYGTLVDVPDPTREGYTFLGWEPELPHYMPDTNGAYTAKWGHTYEVSVTVLNQADNSPVPNAIVQLFKGSELIKTLNHTSDGRYTAGDIADGDYSVVVVVGSKTASELLKISGANQQRTVIVPTTDVSSTVEVTEGTPETMVGGLSELANKMQVNAGESVMVRLTVEGKKDLTQTDDSELTDTQKQEKRAQQAIKALAESSGSDMKVEFIDMGILKTVSGGSAPGRTPIRDSGTVLEIVVDYPTANRYSFGVYRHHTDDQGTESRIAFRALSSRPASGFQDGTFYQGDGFLVIYARYFSTYAIGYSTTPPAPQTPQEDYTPVTRSDNRDRDDGPAGIGSFPVTVLPSAGGGAKADYAMAPGGTRVTVTVTSGSAAGITVTDRFGGRVQITDNGDGTYSFTMPNSPVTVNVSFAAGSAAAPVSAPASPAVTGVADWLNTDQHIVYISGYEDNTVRPDRSITRAEAAMMFYRLLKNKDVPVTQSFTDVAEGAWYAQPCGVLASLGAIDPDANGAFRPDDAITRAEFARLAVRFARAAGTGASFDDVPAGYWAEDAIATAAAYGWVNGYEDGTFRPEDSMTRATAAKIINYMLGRAADRDYVLASRERLVPFSDLQDTGAWYYFELVEASTPHSFTLSGGVERWGA